MIAITAATAGSDYKHARLHPAPPTPVSADRDRVSLFAALTRSHFTRIIVQEYA